KLIGGGQHMGIVYFAAWHGYNAPVMTMPFMRIRGQHVPTYLTSFYSCFLIVRIATLNNKSLYHPMEHGIVKIAFFGKVNKIRLVIGNIIEKLNGDGSESGGQPYLVFGQGLVIFIKEVYGIVIGEFKIIFFLFL